MRMSYSDFSATQLCRQCYPRTNKIAVGMHYIIMTVSDKNIQLLYKSPNMICCNIIVRVKMHLTAHPFHLFLERRTVCSKYIYIYLKLIFINMSHIILYAGSDTSVSKAINNFKYPCHFLFK